MRGFAGWLPGILFALAISAIGVRAQTAAQARAHSRESRCNHDVRKR